MTCGAYIHKRSADTNLVEIHEELSELLDKQVNVQNENFWDSSKLMKKVCNENERKNKNDYRIKLFVVKGRTL